MYNLNWKCSLDMQISSYLAACSSCSFYILTLQPERKLPASVFFNVVCFYTLRFSLLLVLFMLVLLISVGHLNIATSLDFLTLPSIWSCTLTWTWNFLLFLLVMSELVGWVKKTAPQPWPDLFFSIVIKKSGYRF